MKLFYALGAAAIVALSGCSFVTGAAALPPAAPAPPLPAAAPVTSASEPSWGKGWVGAHQDGIPVLRPDAAANERLADAMAAQPPYDWTGRQAACLDELWMKVSDFDNFYSDGVSGDNGIAQLAGWVTDPAPSNPALPDRAAGWFSAQPYVQIAAALVDIRIYWGTPCAEWAADAPASVPAGAYPPEPGTRTGNAGWRAQAGHLTFVVTGGRLALDPETFEFICGLPGLPAAEPAPACAGITQATTWPL